MMRDVPYEEAHEAANELEKKARHNEKITESIICEQYGGMNMPCCKQEVNMDLRTEKQKEDKKAMEEASKLGKPTLVRLEGQKTLENLMPMPPTEGPPLPRMLNLKWPWKK
jgi:hypothetical protein